eukprot:10753142-Alexandrium_andersonii.AAC.1
MSLTFSLRSQAASSGAVHHQRRCARGALASAARYFRRGPNAAPMAIRRRLTFLVNRWPRSGAHTCRSALKSRRSLGAPWLCPSIRRAEPRQAACPPRCRP